MKERKKKAQFNVRNSKKIFVVNWVFDIQTHFITSLQQQLFLSFWFDFLFDFLILFLLFIRAEDAMILFVLIFCVDFFCSNHDYWKLIGSDSWFFFFSFVFISFSLFTPLGPCFTFLRLQTSHKAQAKNQANSTKTYNLNSPNFFYILTYEQKKSSSTSS